MIRGDGCRLCQDGFHQDCLDGTADAFSRPVECPCATDNHGADPRGGSLPLPQAKSEALGSGSTPAAPTITPCGCTFAGARCIYHKGYDEVMDHVSRLVQKIGLGKRPLLPDPFLPQDVAFLAHMIDSQELQSMCNITDGVLHRCYEHRAIDAEAERDQLQEQVNVLRDAQKCASCGGTICPPMQCGHCIETQKPVPGMPERPATTNLQERLKVAELQLQESEARLVHFQVTMGKALDDAKLQISDLKEKNADLRRIYDAACDVFEPEETLENALKDLASVMRDYENKNGLTK